MEAGFGAPDYSGTPSVVLLRINQASIAKIDPGTTKIELIFNTNFAKAVLSVNGGTTVSVGFSESTGVPSDMTSSMVYFNPASQPTGPQLAWRIAHAINNASGGSGDFTAAVPGVAVEGDSSVTSVAAIDWTYPRSSAYAVMRSASVPLTSTEPAASVATADDPGVLVATKLHGSASDFYVMHPVASGSTLPVDYSAVDIYAKVTNAAGVALADSPIAATAGGESTIGGVLAVRAFPGSFELVSGTYTLNSTSTKYVHAPQKWLDSMWTSIMGTKWSFTSKARYDWGLGSSVNSLWPADGGTPWAGAPNFGAGSELDYLSNSYESDTSFGSPYSLVHRRPVPIKPPRRRRLTDPPPLPAPTRAIQDSGGTILQVYADEWPLTVYRIQFRATGTSATFPQGVSTFCLSYKPNDGINLRPTPDQHFVRFVTPVLPPGIYDLLLTAPKKKDFVDVVIHRFARVVRRVRNNSTFIIRNGFSGRYKTGPRRFTTENVRTGGAGK